MKQIYCVITKITHIFTKIIIIFFWSKVPFCIVITKKRITKLSLIIDLFGLVIRFDLKIDF